MKEKKGKLFKKKNNKIKFLNSGVNEVDAEW
jgi:hypothetical protein